MSEKQRIASRGGRALVLAAGLLSAVFFLFTGSASAFPETSSEFPARWCETGTGAGQCRTPRGIAADPRNGHVFIADQVNRRINEFNALGQFVKAWGWGVDTGAAELQTCTASSGCQSGLTGAGAGQFGEFGPQGLALDSAANVYVTDFSNRRVQKFDSKGNFLWMVGGGVNETGPGNVCPRPGFPADVCKAAPAASGIGSGEFSWSEKVGDFIAVDEKGTPTVADDIVYAGDVGRIEKFDAEGVYQGEIAVPGTVQSLTVDATGNLYAIYANKAHKLSPSGEDITPPGGFPLLKFGAFENPVPTAVAVDSAEHVYLFGPTEATSPAGEPREPITEFDQTGKVIDEFGKGEFSAESTGLATNLCPGSKAPGNLYASNPSSSDAFIRAYGSNPVGCFKARTGPAEDIEETSARLTGTVIPSGLAVSECFFEWGETTAYGEVAECDPKASEITGTEPVPVQAQLGSLTKGTIYHFRLLAKVGAELETGADEEFKTLGPPVLSEERTVSVASSEATLKALINPEGFASNYHFEYTTKSAFDKEGFTGAQSTPAIAVGKDGDRSEHAVSATLTGLTPGTAYRWRLVASNSSGATESATPHAFATYRGEGPVPTCPNEAFRTGPSAKLPDCRAYEMVSPVQKNGGDIVTAPSTESDPGGYIQVAPDGNSLSYTALYASFAGQPTSGAHNEYLGSRGAGGWTSEGIHPPVEGHQCCAVHIGLEREFLGFSADLCSAWVIDYQTPALRPEGQDGVPNLYRRDNCGAGAGSLETITDAPLPQGTFEFYVDPNSLQGISKDGSHAVFRSTAPLLQDCRIGATTAKAISYQWLRNGAPIEGATAPLYRPVAADRGTALQCEVFAINENAGATQVSNPASVIARADGEAIAPPIAPGGIAPPAASSTLTVGGAGGQTLTCDPNEAFWEGTPSFSYQWYRNGAAIAGATASTYVASAADVATPAVFQCAVTGTNASGAVTKVSGNRATSPGPTSPAAPAVSAKSGGEMARIYDRFGGENHLVSVLPSGRPAEEAAGVGSPPNVGGAVSEDGSRVYWGTGKLYLRLHPEQGIVANECSDNATVACTLEASLGGTFFWAASADGSKALYTEEEKLRIFDLGKAEEGKPLAQNRELVAGGVSGVVGASEDLSRIYFVSREKLAPGAVAGEPNLYLHEEGAPAPSLVGTLLEGDVGAREPGANIFPYDLDATEPYFRAARVTPDGAKLVFESRAPLSEFDNRDSESGQPSVEVYSFDAASDELTCISCNPSGARPRGREMQEPYRHESVFYFSKVSAAAWIPTPEHALNVSNVISADGKRIFFNASDALLPADANGAQDVYEWEAPGSGSCGEESANFFAENGGCLYLISSGQSARESEFWEASPDGQNVFFNTESSLVPPDPSSVDLYDARVGGGFEYPTPKPPCEGEACQSPPPPPQLPTPSSGTYTGPPNPKPKAASRCPKGKHRVRQGGKSKCVKAHKKAHKGKAHHKRRAAR